MQIPASGFIQIAQQELEKLPVDTLGDQQRELMSAVPDASLPFSHGYMLGLQVARVLLQTNQYLALRGVKAEDLL